MISETGTTAQPNTPFFTATLPGFYSVHVHASVSGGLVASFTKNGQIQGGGTPRQTAVTCNTNTSPLGDTFTFLLAPGDVLGRSVSGVFASWTLAYSVERNGDEL